MIASRRYFTLDVFTATPFAGNPLAVVMDSDGLDDAMMQGIAREFNLSETVFVAPAKNNAHRADIRIFTPGRELPFAGHPTVGTAVLLAILDSAGAAGSSQFVLNEKIGAVPCAVTVTGPRLGRSVFTLPRLPERLPAHYSTHAMAAAFQLAAADIGIDGYEAALFSAGVPFPVVPVRSRKALDGLAVPTVHDLEKAFGADAGHVLLFCREPVGAQHHFYARMFAPGLGVAEDPATGSAAAAFAGAIMAFDHPGNGHHRFVIEQGYAMGRPSNIHLTLDVKDGALQAASIGGDAVIITEGRLLA